MWCFWRVMSGFGVPFPFISLGKMIEVKFSNVWAGGKTGDESSLGHGGGSACDVFFLFFFFLSLSLSLSLSPLPPLAVLWINAWGMSMATAFFQSREVKWVWRLPGQIRCCLQRQQVLLSRFRRPMSSTCQATTFMLYPSFAGNLFPFTSARLLLPHPKTRLIDIQATSEPHLSHIGAISNHIQTTSKPHPKSWRKLREKRFLAPSFLLQPTLPPDNATPR